MFIAIQWRKFRYNVLGSMTINSRRNFTFHQAQQAFQWLSAKISHALYSVALSLFFLLSTPLLHAATNPGTPDAGQILQQIERDLQVNPLPKLPEVQSPEPVIEDTQVEKVVIKQFKVTGNHLLTEAELMAVLAPLTNRSISIIELKTCTDLIAALYQQKGFLATATLPEQDVTEGVVLIEIVEAIFGDVKIDGTYGKDFKRIRPSVIEDILHASSPKGQAVDQAKIDHALAILQRLSGFTAESSFQAGKEEHSTDLLIKVADKPLFTFGFSADNSGGLSTGKKKETATVDVASPLKFGDSFNLTALHTDGTDYARASYTIPVGSHGLQLGANTSYMTYKFINPMAGGDITPLGQSVTYNLNANYPILISNSKKLNAEMTYEKKYFLNKMSSGSEVKTETNYSLDVISMLISGNYIDGFLGGAQTNASLNLGVGKVDLNGSPNITLDLNGSNTQGSYKRLHWGLSRNQFFTDTLSLNLDASGQAANRNLDSSEKFYLGGVNGVRAYPTSEGSGSDGYLLKAELLQYLPYNLNVSLFVDKGHVKQYHMDQLSPGSSFTVVGPSNYDLEGYGATMGWSGPYRSSFKATYAHRMGKNPNPSTLNNTNDQDGSLRLNVFWFSGSVAL